MLFLAKIETIAIEVTLIIFFSQMSRFPFIFLRQKLGFNDVIPHGTNIFAKSRKMMQIRGEILNGRKVGYLNIRRDNFSFSQHKWLFFPSNIIVNGKNILDKNTSINSWITYNLLGIWHLKFNEHLLHSTWNLFPNNSWKHTVNYRYVLLFLLIVS